MELVKRAFGLVWDLVEATAFALGLVVVSYFFLFQTAEVQGNSSFPTLKTHERMIVEKVTYRFEKPQRGDFIIMQSPQNPDIDFIKRIVGLPGEKIEITEGKVYINDQPLDENYLQPGIYTSPDQKIIIPHGYYFVMGDNRTQSSDSRVFGPIPEKSIVGKVLLRFWPPENIGLLK